MRVFSYDDLVKSAFLVISKSLQCFFYKRMQIEKVFQVSSYHRLGIQVYQMVLVEISGVLHDISRLLYHHQTNILVSNHDFEWIVNSLL